MGILYLFVISIIRCSKTKLNFEIGVNNDIPMKKINTTANVEYFKKKKGMNDAALIPIYDISKRKLI